MRAPQRLQEENVYKPLTTPVMVFLRLTTVFMWFLNAWRALEDV